MTQDEVDLVRRALAMRKLRKIGILLAEDGRYWITEDEFDPWGSRVSISLAALALMVEAAEATVRIPPQSEKSIQGQQSSARKA